jgi:hypothetical protein
VGRTLPYHISTGGVSRLPELARDSDAHTATQLDAGNWQKSLNKNDMDKPEGTIDLR